MATIWGKWTGYGSTYNDDYVDDLVGTNLMDVIYGLGGYDTLDGGGGPDKIYGGGGRDTIYGGTGADLCVGGDGRDIIYGGDQGDQLYGGDDQDFLYGEGGNDALYGDAGHDELTGGVGIDILTGGTGFDTFKFELQNAANGWTDSKITDPDHITDFSGADDWIDVEVPGTSANYIEKQISGNSLVFGYDAAKDWALDHMTGNVRYAFVSDGFNGFLFADLNGNGIVETGIVLEGVTSTSDFQFSNIF
jgi:Ca2+-binding RTX toxin-like protein